MNDRNGLPVALPHPEGQDGAGGRAEAQLAQVQDRDRAARLGPRRCGQPIDGLFADPEANDGDPFVGANVLPSGNSLPDHIPAPSVRSSAGVRTGRDVSLGDQVRRYSEHGDPETNGVDKARRKQPDHNERTRKHWEALGYQCDRVDGWMATGMSYRKKDFQGIWDMMATAPGKQLVLIQITDGTHVGTHLSKMVGLDEAPDNKRPRRHNLRHMMACGFRCVFHVWRQAGGPGGRWEGEVRDITDEMVAGAVARKRDRA